MTDFRRICDALRDVGVKEVILQVRGDGVAYIEFNGKFDGNYFTLQANNEDFSEHDL